MPNWIGRWDGGRISKGHDGHRAYFIERRVQGKVVALRLTVRSTADANAELALFNRDPPDYVDRHRRQREARLTIVGVTQDAVTDFLQALAERGTTTNYRTTTRTALDRWQKALDGRDLRRVLKSDLDRALAKMTGRKHQIIAIKSFCSWLVETGELQTHENPTAALKVPPSRRTANPRGYTPAEISAAYEKIGPVDAKTHPVDADTAQAVRDVFVLAAYHGLHFSEIERIATAAAEMEVLDGEADAAIAGKVTFKHKTGDLHVISLGPQALRAAMRLRGRGGAPVESCMRRYLKEALKRQEADDKKKGRPPPEKKRERLKLGGLRHSFISIANAAGVEVVPTDRVGVPLKRVSEIVGHRSTSTTRRFYLSVDVPPLIKIPVPLVNADDPKIEPARVGPC